MKIYLNLFLFSCLFFNPHTNFCSEFEESETDVTSMSSFNKVCAAIKKMKKSAGPEWVEKYYYRLDFTTVAHENSVYSFERIMESRCKDIPASTYAHFNFEQLKNLLTMRNEIVREESNRRYDAFNEMSTAACNTQQVKSKKYIESINKMREFDRIMISMENDVFKVIPTVFVQSSKRQRSDISRVNQQYQDQQNSLPSPGGIASKRVKFAEDSNLNEMFIIDYTLPVSSKSDVV